MRNGKYAKKNVGMGFRTVALLMALTLLVGGIVGGTIAWLTASSQDIVNTFTVGDISIALQEHKYENGKLTADVVQTNTYETFVPGDVLPKDPYVTITNTSEKCYLFVTEKVENNVVTVGNGNVTVLSYAMDSNWELVITEADGTNVYAYKLDGSNIIDPSTVAQPINVLNDKQVTVSTGVTKDMKNTLETNKPKMTFKAYAIQADNLNVTALTDIWALAKTNGAPTT